MLLHFITIALRNFKRHRLFSLINLFGLALGISAALLIFLYVRFERSYDGFHSRKDRIYRVICDDQTPSNLRKESHTGAGIGPIIKSDLPGVEDFVRVWPAAQGITLGTTKFREEHSIYADGAFLTMFDFPLQRGDPKTALINPNTVVVSETAARKYFGAADPMGRSMLLTDAGTLLTVTGVMKDIPENSHIRADVLMSMPTLLTRQPDWLEQFKVLVCYTYVLLKPGVGAQRLETQLPGLLQKYAVRQPGSKQSLRLSLEPLTEVYLHSDREVPVKGSALNVTIFSIIAGFILLIAGINFVNLSTARAVDRAKEVGVRKMMGSARQQLILQFLAESVFQCLLAGGLAILLASVFLPMFNSLAGKTVSQGLYHETGAVFILLAVSICIGIAAGFYPALVLSGFRPVSMLKEHYSSSQNGVILRQLLVVVQFTLSIVLIAGTVIVYSQLHFMRNQRLGFDKEQEVVIGFHRDERVGVFRDELENLFPHVLSTTFSTFVPGQRPDFNRTRIENAQGQMQETSFPALYVEFNFVRHYQLQIVAGRDFDPDLGTDSSHSLLINEAAAAAFGYSSPADAVGKRYSQHGDGRIIGVVRNFHIRGLGEAIEPMSLRAGPYWLMEVMTVKISTADVPATMDAIQKAWDKALPEKTMSYFFLNEAFNNLYIGEMQFGRLFMCFAVLAIIISCLGLFGLAAHSAVQRRREIAIRKVLGADVQSIFRLLSGGFLRPVLLALIIGTTAAWIVMHDWLQHFAYRTAIDWRIFGLTGGITILITLVTVSHQVIQAARANPADHLRAE